MSAAQFLEQVIAVLQRTPATLDAMLRGLPESLVLATEGGESWSPFDVMGHLVHGEKTDWIPRLRITGTHPDFGLVRAGELLATWTAHDLGHIVQIARTMARQFGDAVGPWRGYLPVLGA